MLYVTPAQSPHSVISNTIASEWKKALDEQDELDQKALGLPHVDGCGVSARISEGTSQRGKNPIRKVSHPLYVGKQEYNCGSSEGKDAQIRTPSASQRVANTPPP